MLFALMTLWAMQDECEDNRAPRPIQYYVNNTQQLVGFMFVKQTGAGVCVQRIKKRMLFLNARVRLGLYVYHTQRNNKSSFCDIAQKSYKSGPVTAVSSNADWNGERRKWDNWQFSAMRLSVFSHFERVISRCAKQNCPVAISLATCGVQSNDSTQQLH